MDKTLQSNIQNLSPEQQLEVAQFIYSSLASSGLLLTESQMAETHRRAIQVKKHPESMLSSDEMWKIESTK